MTPCALVAEEAGQVLEAWAASDREYADYTSREGAMELKAKIEAYWRDRGHHVMIALHNVGFHPAIRAARFDVRSDMVNGLPRTTARAKAKWVDAAQHEDVDVEAFDPGDDDLAFE